MSNIAGIVEAAGKFAVLTRRAAMGFVVRSCHYAMVPSCHDDAQPVEWLSTSAAEDVQVHYLLIALGTSVSVMTALIEASCIPI
jgi:hypothetical protein